MLLKDKFNRRKFRYNYQKRLRYQRIRNKLRILLPYKLFIVAFLVFVLSVLFIVYIIKPGLDINLKIKQTVENITGGIGNASCKEVTEVHWYLETRNFTVKYDVKHTFLKEVHENYSIFIGKVNITNLENFSALFIVNYTFNTTFGTAPSENFSANQTILGGEYYVFPFFVNLSKGNESSGSFTVIAPTYNKTENITYTNKTTVC